MNYDDKVWAWCENKLLSYTQEVQYFSVKKKPVLYTSAPTAENMGHTVNLIHHKTVTLVK